MRDRSGWLFRRLASKAKPSPMPQNVEAPKARRTVRGYAPTAEDQALLEAAIRLSLPLLIAALGELIIERAGLINIGTEGMMLCGAFAGFANTLLGNLTLSFCSLCVKLISTIKKAIN